MSYATEFLGRFRDPEQMGFGTTTERMIFPNKSRPINNGTTVAKVALTTPFLSLDRGELGIHTELGSMSEAERGMSLEQWSVVGSTFGAMHGAELASVLSQIQEPHEIRDDSP
ncbi:predicted protein [Pyrenophora tritici-repentis Pt-1C-BFP]|uniref:Uncharacterized protein n=1 Tax=Pyrenophora tritici-repentis (strain Pt-1C-BFP) TaxID=426418 RepID=B2W3G3_PYRTR|nr:uncharacterized protein PTRG_05013 [Pyrenophora tritici-repentis Pt-1C-BFP]EDU47920.1 predicted protein [Pyrenophora tritici-repentis Pt-1C-BFP]